MGPDRRTMMGTLGVLLALALTACAGSRAGGGPDGSARGPDPGGTGSGIGPGGVPPSAVPLVPGPQAGVPGRPGAGILTDRLVGTRVDRIGEVVTDAGGWILYRFDRDSASPPVSNCSGECAAVWPPVLVTGTPQATGITGRVGTLTRPDGGTQATLGGWPLYRYIGDRAPGAWTGQGVSAVWFVVAPTGAPNKGVLPTGTPTPVAPPTPSARGGY